MKKKTIKQRIGIIFHRYGPFNARTIRFFRSELNSIIITFIFYFSPFNWLKRKRINKLETVNLNLGCGAYGLISDDWINIDIAKHHKCITFAYDIRKTLPFKNNSVDRIFSEHVIEHFEMREDIPKFFSEAYRILKPGGRIRIIVPDGEKWIRAYVYNTDEKWNELGMNKLPHDMPTNMCMINHVFHQDGEHCFAFDFETMKYFMVQAGFKEIKKTEFGKSIDPKLCLDMGKYKQFSLYVDAAKLLN